MEVNIPFLIQNVALTNKNQARNVVCDVFDDVHLLEKCEDKLSYGDKILIKQLVYKSYASVSARMTNFCIKFFESSA